MSPKTRPNGPKLSPFGPNSAQSAQLPREGSGALPMVYYYRTPVGHNNKPSVAPSTELRNPPTELRNPPTELRTPPTELRTPPAPDNNKPSVAPPNLARISTKSSRIFDQNFPVGEATQYGKFRYWWCQEGTCPGGGLFGVKKLRFLGQKVTDPANRNL